MKTTHLLLTVLLIGASISFGNITAVSAQDTTSGHHATPGTPLAPPDPQMSPAIDQQQQNGSRVLGNDQEAVNNGQPAIQGIPVKVSKRKKVKKDTAELKANVADSLPPHQR